MMQNIDLLKFFIHANIIFFNLFLFIYSFIYCEVKVTLSKL